jgi:lathosterol oxidase
MDWLAWAKIVAPSMFAGVAILWLVGGYYHLRYYRARRSEPERWKCQPQRFLTPALARHAMILSTANLAMAGVISGSVIYAVTRGLKTPVYVRVADYGWAYTLASTVLLFVIVDGLAYYAHRALHSKFMFRYVHRWHHRYLAPTPFVVTAMHPIEMVIFQLVTFAPLFLIPFHAVSIAAVLVYILVFNIIDHSGVKLESRWPWQGPSTFHDDHHAHFHCNFGQHLMLWDRLHGTLRRVNRRYGVDVFGGKGAGGSGAADDFVRY